MTICVCVRVYVCCWQVCSSPGLDDPCHPHKDEGVSAGGGNDAETRRPDVPSGDEVSQQAGGVPHRLDHGQLTSTEHSGPGRRLHHVQVSVRPTFGTLDPRYNAVIWHHLRGPRCTEMRALGLYTCLETTTRHYPLIVH